MAKPNNSSVARKRAKKAKKAKEAVEEEQLPAPVEVVETNHVGRPMHQPRGLEDVDQEDLVIPRFNIVQPMSEEGTPGHFRDNISGEEYEVLEGLVPLKWSKGRVYFLSQDEGGGLACASDDRISPAERIEEPISDRCAGCPKAVWRTENGKRIKPDCSETWSLLSAYDNVPYFITFKSAAMKATKRLLTQLKLQAQKQRRDLCGFQFDVRLQLEKFDVGKAYLPVFENLRLVDAGEYSNYQTLYDAFGHADPVFDDDEPKAATGTDFDFGENEE
jgi:hypothetical protein